MEGAKEHPVYGGRYEHLFLKILLPRQKGLLPRQNGLGLTLTVTDIKT